MSEEKTYWEATPGVAFPSEKRAQRWLDLNEGKFDKKLGRKVSGKKPKKITEAQYNKMAGIE